MACFSRCRLVPPAEALPLCSLTARPVRLSPRSWKALLAAGGANVAAAFRGQETKRVMADPALKAGIGGSANA